MVYSGSMQPHRVSRDLSKSGEHFLSIQGNQVASHLSVESNNLALSFLLTMVCCILEMTLVKGIEPDAKALAIVHFPAIKICFYKRKLVFR